MDDKVFSLDETQTFFVNNSKHLDLGAAAAMSFFSYCANWFLHSNEQQRKIRIVIDHDPVIGKTTATFSAVD